MDEKREASPRYTGGVGWYSSALAKRAVVLSGANHHTETVIIRFPDIESITGSYKAPAYQVLIPLREQAAWMDLEDFESNV